MEQYRAFFITSKLSDIEFFDKYIIMIELKTFFARVDTCIDFEFLHPIKYYYRYSNIK